MTMGVHDVEGLECTLGFLSVKNEGNRENKCQGNPRERGREARGVSVAGNTGVEQPALHVEEQGGRFLTTKSVEV
jgi:hypothetical protein